MGSVLLLFIIISIIISVSDYSGEECARFFFILWCMFFLLTPLKHALKKDEHKPLVLVITAIIIGSFFLLISGDLLTPIEYYVSWHIFRNRSFMGEYLVLFAAVSICTLISIFLLFRRNKKPFFNVQAVKRLPSKPAENTEVCGASNFCPKCGNPRGDGHQFCTKCGYHFTTQSDISIYMEDRIK